MRLPHQSIARPISATVASLIILLLGAGSMLGLPVAEYPEVVPPTIAINAAYPGANPETIAETVASPLEQEMTGLPNLLYQESQSLPDGAMQLTLTFDLEADLDTLLPEVQNRVQRATPRLPEEVRRLGVTTEKATRNLLMVVHLRSPDGSMSMLDLGNFARLRVEDELASLPGVSSAPVFGAGEYSMRVWLDPLRMDAHGLTPSDVTAAIRSQNIQIAAGSLGQQPDATARAFQITLNTQGRLTEPEEFKRIVVKRSDTGTLTRLADVARVELGANSYSLRSLLDNQTAAAMPIFQAPNSNALAVSTAVRAKMAELDKDFPAGVEYTVVYDPTEFISASIDAVIETLFEALILVVIVVILFLQTWRASIIPLLAVPVSIIGTFAIMLPMGFTINALSLFGLVLAIGIVVDDAIVVVENVERHLRMGKSRKAAAHAAMREVAGPVVATTLVLCAVFIPTAFVTGLTGQFYQQFSLTIAIATIISTFNSLTMSPALAAVLLKPQVEGQRPGGWLFGWFFAGFNWMFDRMAGLYAKGIKLIVRRTIISIALYLGLLGVTGWIFQQTPSSFVPPQDKGYLICIVQLPDGASLDRTEAVVRQVGDIGLQHPAVAGAVGFPGLSVNGFTNVSNAGIVFLPLKPFEERLSPETYGEAVAGQLQGQLFGSIDQAFVLCVNPPPILGLGTTGGFKLFLQDKGNVGSEALFGAAQATLGAVFQTPILGQSYTSATMSVPRVAIDIDRDRILAQDVSLEAVYDAIEGYFGQRYVNDFNAFGRTWQVNLQAEADARDASADLTTLKVRSNSGQLISLASFISLRETAGPERTMHYNTFEAIDINSGAAPGVSGDAAKAAMEGILQQTLPPGVDYQWTELTYQQILAGNSGVWIYPICVLLVLMVLAAFYESITLPLAIVLIVPMCLLSALLGVWVVGGDNNIMTQIGLIVLFGLACKNAILIVEFAREAELKDGLSPVDAALLACRTRLRPILMTSISFILGVWPLVAASGAGAELRHATGITVFAGMIGVTVFGLLLTPVFYVALRKCFPGKLPDTTLNEYIENDPDTNQPT